MHAELKRCSPMSSQWYTGPEPATPMPMPCPTAPAHWEGASTVSGEKHVRESSVSRRRHAPCTRGPDQSSTNTPPASAGVLLGMGQKGRRGLLPPLRPLCSPDQSHAQLQQQAVGAPMARVAVDIMGPFPHTDTGNRNDLVAMDYFTKWPEAYTIPDQEAETVVDALVEGMFSRKHCGWQKPSTVTKEGTLSRGSLPPCGSARACIRPGPQPCTPRVTASSRG